MAPLSGEVGCSLALVVGEFGVGTVGKQQFGQIAVVGRDSGHQRRKPADLACIDGGTLLQQQCHDGRVSPDGHGGVQGMVPLGIARHGVDARAVGQESGHGCRCAEGGSKVKSGPAIPGHGLRSFRLFGEDLVQPRLIASGCCLKDIQRCAVGGKVRCQKVTHQRLAGVNGPEQSGNTLRVAVFDQRRIPLDGVGDPAVAPVLIICRNGFMDG